MESKPKSILPTEEEKYVKFILKDGFIYTERKNVSQLEILGIIERIKYSELAIAREKVIEQNKRLKEQQIDTSTAQVWTFKDKTKWTDIPGAKNLKFKKVEMTLTNKKAAKKKPVKKVKKAKK